MSDEEAIVADIQKQALLYISNTKQNATLEHFIEDYGLVGQIIWDDLEADGLVGKNADGKLILTHKGQQVISGQ